MKGTERPYVICHMIPSIDGRIVTTRHHTQGANPPAADRAS